MGHEFKWDTKFIYGLECTGPYRNFTEVVGSGFYSCCHLGTGLMIELYRLFLFITMLERLLLFLSLRINEVVNKSRNINVTLVQ